MESDYQLVMSQRKAANRQLLKELGILNEKFEDSFKSPTDSSRNASLPPKSKQRTKIAVQPTRRSSRLQSIEPIKYDLPEDEVDIDEEKYEKSRRSIENIPKVKPPKRPNSFGAIDGVAVGTHFPSRLDASAAGIHRPTVAGIHGNPSLGCYSIALSGGYEDDVDEGDKFSYTGEGGRDLKGTKANPKNLRTAPQSKDQVLERGNLALYMNVKNNLPVRVLRGYKLKSPYAPPEGYRYDGLYNVCDCWETVGKSGFKIIKFKMERVQDQEPAPWSNDFNKETKENEQD